MTENADTNHSDLVARVIADCCTLSSDLSSSDVSRLAHAAPLPEGGSPSSALMAILQEKADVVHCVSHEEVLREIDWRRFKEDGKRPDLPDTEIRFEAEQALAMLLLNEVIFLNSHHWEDEWPAEARATAYLGVNCNDVFAWGCSDAEGAGYADLETVYRYWRKDPSWGPSVWCMIKRREMPQRPVEKRIREEGIWDLDALAQEHGLRPNHYDGISGVWASQKYEAYCAWERAEGRNPMPFDVHWWEGWKRYVAAHPDWDDAAWKAEESRRSDAWRIESGHEPRSQPASQVDVAAETTSLAHMLEAAAERRRSAADASVDSARTYLTQEAERTERDVLRRLPALLSALRQSK